MPERTDVIVSSADDRSTHSDPRCSMGDRSPKSKEKDKKQDTASKNQKKAEALSKANPAPPTTLKRGK
jgi:hypothetical protein